MRHGNGTFSKVDANTCTICFNPIEQKPGSGRAKLYCSEQCRKIANGKTKTLICRICNKQFENDNQGRNPKYCSDICRGLDKSTKRKNPSLLDILTCPVCLKEFKRKGRQIFCSKQCQRRESAWRRKFEISIEDYRFLWNKQRGMCVICEWIAPNFGDLFVDHDHNNGHVRGLLCHHCNSGLGMFKDSVKSLERAIWYLN